MVGKIATGEITEEELKGKVPGRRKGGLKGAKARTKKLTPVERSEIARTAAMARWKKSDR